MSRELTKEQIDDITQVAIRHAEWEPRALNECYELDLEEDSMFWWASYRLNSDGLEIAIQQWLDGKRSCITADWWVGTGGSWGEQVFGSNPPKPSEHARQMASRALHSAHANLRRAARRSREQALATLATELRAKEMGIGTSPKSPTRPAREYHDLTRRW